MNLFRILHLNIVKWCYGPFSSRYFITAVKLRQRFPSRRLPFRECFAEEIIVHFDNLVNRMEQPGSFHSSKNLCLEQVPFGLSKRDLIRTKGIPSCAKYETYRGASWEVLGYREIRRQHPVRIYYFFLNDAFFFGEYRLGETKPASPFIQPEVPTNESIAERNLRFIGQFAPECGAPPGLIESGRTLCNESGKMIYLANHGDYQYLRFFDGSNQEARNTLMTLFEKWGTKTA